MNILILGAGRMGRAIAFDCLKQKDVKKVIVADKSEDQIKTSLHGIENPKLHSAILDVTNLSDAASLMAGNSVVISAVPYMYNLNLAKTAVETGCNFCDLGGNTDIVHEELKLNEKAIANNVTLIPDCGLAPGLANAAAAYLIEEFEEVDSVKIRVGGLPVNPVPPLNYMQLFSVHGLLNEYLGEAVTISNGKIELKPAMSGLEEIGIGEEFPEMEAFYTLGGTSTLPETYLGRVKNLDYKTIRYKGHCNLIKAMFDIGLADLDEVELGSGKVVPRELLAAMLEKNLPSDGMDVTLVKIEVSGVKSGKKLKSTWEIIDRYDDENAMTSMMRMTGYPAAIVGLMLARGNTNGPGALPQEKALKLDKFMDELKMRNINFNVKEGKVK
ncbi:MAG: saccharopine dehydrogenase NADP-binding domain-containing protein [Candidatus Marinimicrobia bacterium]|nr:saccharopine dehydrogenase NADP-binding domain-containing protein [Candidatus Neomarinimicrobiota bacterium]